MYTKNGSERGFGSEFKKFIKKINGLFGGNTTTTPTTTPTTIDEVDYSTIRWEGAPKCTKSVVADGVQIGNLKISGNKLTYSWIKGGCETLGATSKDDCDHTQCNLGVKVGGTWEMRKFDWISTSRTSRGLEHCASGYNGFNIDAFNSATEFCFCITGVAAAQNSPTGKRTNVIYFKV